MKSLSAAEEVIDTELNEYFAAIAGSSTNTNKAADVDNELRTSVLKIEAFSPHFEGMVQNSKKLSLQVDDAHALSDRVSVMVRRLDNMQLRAQQALACTEDILTLKDCKIQLEQAIDSRDLLRAVKSLKQVQKISPEAAATSDDYAHILKLESSVKNMVQKAFSDAIEASEINEVMALCPLLQTLGLETIARDQFLDFVEQHVFIAVTADEASAGDAVDASQGYAHALSSMFNASHLILQKYLPMVITGMENSYGDIHFIRRLHARCAREAGLVLKRYMKFRNVRDVVSHIRQSSGYNNSDSIGTLARGMGSSLGLTGSGAGGSSSDATALSQQEVHVMLDELTLLIQYCSKYSRYIKQLSVGAHSRVRPNAVKIDDNGKEVSLPLQEATALQSGSEEKISFCPPSQAASLLFPGPVEFDKMVDELTSNYYMEAERWLMTKNMRGLGIFTLAENGAFSVSNGNSFAAVLDTAGGVEEMGNGIDECFYVLQRCGLRSAATHNIHAACAILHFVSDLLSSEFLGHLSDVLGAATDKINIAMITHVSRYIKQIKRSHHDKADEDDAEYGGIDQLDKAFLSGYQSAMALATTYGSTGSSNGNEAGAGGYSDKIKSYLRSDAGSSSVDTYGIADCAGVFNVMERCSRYVKRLGEEVVSSGEATFGNSSGSSGTADADLLALCREDFTAAEQNFTLALNQHFTAICDSAKNIIRDLMQQVLGRSGLLGGLRFDAYDDVLDDQPALGLLPSTLVTPIQTLIDISTAEMSEKNKETLLGMIVDVICERIEHFVTQTTFRFAGALKFDECVRAVISMCNKESDLPIRSKFSRLREVMMVLTSDVRSTNFAESLSQLTPTEAQAIINLRLDTN